MGNELLKKMNILERVKNIMDQPLSELECRDAALSYLEQYYDDFGFDAMENQIYLMSKAYELIAEEAGTDYGGVEMQKHIKGQGEALRYVVRDIQKLSDQYRDMLAGYLRDFKSDMANIDENQRDNDMSNENDYDTDMENPELNESIEKIKSNFKRFL